MTITGTFLDKSVSNAGSQVQNPAQSTSFGKTFEEVSAKKEFGYSQNNAGRKQTQNNSPKKADNSKTAFDKSKVNADGGERKAENAGTKEKTTETTGIQTDEVVENEKIAAKIVEDVAANLEIPNEVLMEILAVLNIQPTELTDTKNVNLVIQKLLGAEDPIELLSMEGVTELFAGIEESVDAAIKAASEMPVETMVQDMQLQVSEEESLPVNMAAEKTESKPLQKADELAELTTEISESEIQLNTEVSTSGGNQNAGSGTDSDNDAKQSSLFGEAKTEINVEAVPEMEIDANMTAQFAENSTITPAAASKAEAVRITNPQEVTNQIIERVKVDIKPGVSEIRMNLKPESLGEVSLRIASENGVVTAHFIAENQRVKEIIESNFNQLQDALSEQGLNVTELSVSVSNGDNERQMQEFIQGRTKSQARMSSIISAVDENGEIRPNEPDETEIYDNNVNYRA